MVAGPAVVRGNVVQRDVRHVADHAARDGHHVFAASQHVNRLELGERAHQLLPDRGNRLELAWPGVRIMRPGKPRGGVRLPLGGKAIPKLPRRRHERSIRRVARETRETHETGKRILMVHGIRGKTRKGERERKRKEDERREVRLTDFRLAEPMRVPRHESLSSPFENKRRLRRQSAGCLNKSCTHSLLFSVSFRVFRGKTRPSSFRVFRGQNSFSQSLYPSRRLRSPPIVSKRCSSSAVRSRRHFSSRATVDSS